MELRKIYVITKKCRDFEILNSRKCCYTNVKMNNARQLVESFRLLIHKITVSCRYPTVNRLLSFAKQKNINKSLCQNIFLQLNQ